MCHAMLYDSDGQICLGSHDSNDRKPQRSAKGTVPVVDKYHVTVVGQRTVAGEVLRDPSDNKFKIFFIFNNISVRITGRYRWRCSVINMDPLALNAGSTYECISDSFIVYSRRLFPSHTQTTLTQLEKSLMMQGYYFLI